MSEEQPKNICVICPTCKECIYEGEEMDKDWQAIFQEQHCINGVCHIEQPIVIEAKDIKGYNEESVKLIPVKRKRGGRGPKPPEDESKFRNCPWCKEKKKMKPIDNMPGMWECKSCRLTKYDPR